MTFTKDWLEAALTRAIKTMAQTMLGMITVGAAVSDMDWVRIISVSIVAGVYSVLTSIVMTPQEAKNDGTILVDGSAQDPFQLEVTDEKVNEILSTPPKRLSFKTETVTGL